MSNSHTSCRATSWRNWFTDNAFRRGFSDKRAGLGFPLEYEGRAQNWQWMYECGRLFAADPASRPFKHMPERGKPITPTLIKSYRVSLANRAF